MSVSAARAPLGEVVSASLPPVLAVRDDSTGRAGKSAGEIPCDPWVFYRTFRDQWPTFLRAHFRNSAHVAAFFQVDDKTARDWLSGVTHPRGQVVAYAVAAMPAHAGKLLGPAA